MPDYNLEDLEQRLETLLESKLPSQPTTDLNAALQVANLLENRGYSFLMKDLCPRSLSECYWEATFSRDGDTFAAEAAQTPVAICAAAIAALEAPKQS